MNRYFVIRNSEGDTTVESLTREQLLARLGPNGPYYGRGVSFIEEITKTDTNYWPEKSLLIIQGEIVVPEERKVVTEYDVP